MLILQQRAASLGGDGECPRALAARTRFCYTKAGRRSKCDDPSNKWVIREEFDERKIIVVLIADDPTGTRLKESKVDPPTEC